MHWMLWCSSRKLSLWFLIRVSGAQCPQCDSLANVLSPDNNSPVLNQWEYQNLVKNLAAIGVRFWS